LTSIDHRAVPDSAGRFDAFGGRYVPETLYAALKELDAAYLAARSDVGCLGEVDRLLREFVGRPTQLTPAPRLSAHAGGARIWL
jgi:tryptophan synthase beta chain